MADETKAPAPAEGGRAALAQTGPGHPAAVVATRRIADRGDGEPSEPGKVIFAPRADRERWIAAGQARRATDHDVAMAEPRVVRLTSTETED